MSNSSSAGQITPFQEDSLDKVFLAAVPPILSDNALDFLFLIRRDGLSDVDELRRVLSQFQTRICETSLSVQMEMQLSLIIWTGYVLNHSRNKKLAAL